MIQRKYPQFIASYLTSNFSESPISIISTGVDTSNRGVILDSRQSYDTDGSVVGWSYSMFNISLGLSQRIPAAALLSVTHLNSSGLVASNQTAVATYGESFLRGSTPGVALVRVTAIDNDGANRTADSSIVLINGAPVVPLPSLTSVIIPRNSVVAAAKKTVSLSTCSDPEGDALTFTASVVASESLNSAGQVVGTADSASTVLYPWDNSKFDVVNLRSGNAPVRHTVSLSARDTIGGVTRHTIAVIAVLQPEMSISADAISLPYTLAVGETSRVFRLIAGVTNNELNIASYQWKVTGARGAMSVGCEVSSAAGVCTTQFALVELPAGTYTVELTVNDILGLSYTVTQTWIVNIAPTAVLRPREVSVYTDSEGSALPTVKALFNLSSSWDAENHTMLGSWEIVSSRWLSSATGSPPTPSLFADASGFKVQVQSLSSPANYTLRGTVTDQHGGVGSTTTTFRVVQGIKPMLAVSPSVVHLSNATAGADAVTLDGSGTTSFDAIATVTWSIRTAAGSSIATNVVCSNALCTLATITGLPRGSYSVTMTATTVASLSASITKPIVVNALPTVRLATTAAFQIRSGATYALDASSTTDADGDTLTYAWSIISAVAFTYPDTRGTELPSPSISNSTAKPSLTLNNDLMNTASQVTVSLVVTDSRGGQSSTSTVVTFVRPILSTLSVPGYSNRVLSVETTASFSVDFAASLQDAPASSFTWQLLAGQTIRASANCVVGSTSCTSNTFTSVVPSAYTARATITDALGFQSVASTDVVVNRIPTSQLRGRVISSQGQEAFQWDALTVPVWSSSTRVVLEAVASDDQAPVAWTVSWSVTSATDSRDDEIILSNSFVTSGTTAQLYFMQEGSYNITVTITDPYGAETSAEFYLGITVLEAGLAMNVASLKVEEGHSGCTNIAALTTPTHDVLLSLMARPNDAFGLDVQEWNSTILAGSRAPVSVCFSSVDNYLPEDDMTVSLLFRVSSQDPVYGNMADLEGEVVIMDNDFAGIEVTPAEELILVENGTLVLSTRLTAEPRSGLNIQIEFSSAFDELNLLAIEMPSFSSSDWDTWKDLVLHYPGDNVDDPDITGRITLSVSTLDRYFNNATSEFNLTTRNDDLAGIIVSPGFVLSDVVIVPSTLTFTAHNWNIPQAVDLEVMHDFIAWGDEDGSIVFAIQGEPEDAAFADIAAADPVIKEIAITVMDIDSADVTFTCAASPCSVNEGTEEELELLISLASKPSSPVTLSFNPEIAPGARTLTTPAMLLSTTELHITPSSWDATAGDFNLSLSVPSSDDTITGDLSGSIVVTLVTDDEPYSAVTVDPVSILVVDTNVASLVATGEFVSASSISEAASTSFSLKLSSRPLSNVIASLSVSIDGWSGGSSISPTHITFTPASWNVPNTAVVTTIKDGIVRTEPGSLLVEVSTTSADTSYSAVTLQHEVEVEEGDEVAVFVTPSSLEGITIVEGDDPLGVGIVLGSQPTADVVFTCVVTVPGRSESDQTVALTFNDANWFISQYLWLSIADDTFLQAHTSLTVAITSQSSDGAYDGYTTEFSAMVTDNDEAAL
ncbi:unnamed protein product, partial [Symbiodinium sp. KB8]